MAPSAHLSDTDLLEDGWEQRELTISREVEAKTKGWRAACAARSDKQRTTLVRAIERERCERPALDENARSPSREPNPHTDVERLSLRKETCDELSERVGRFPRPTPT